MSTVPLEETMQRSQEWLLAMRSRQDPAPAIRNLRSEAVKAALAVGTNDRFKVAFWINVYNAGFLYLRKALGLYRPAIYRKKALSIGGHQLSLDDIEHGILRRYRWKWSLGYFADPLANPKIKKLAVKNLDPRIHFALNCGARSCPPIRVYDPALLEEQLEMASSSFIESTTQIDQNKRLVEVNRIFLWYRGDFGGRKGILDRIGRQLGDDLSGFRIRYLPYDWGEQLDNFI